MFDPTNSPFMGQQMQQNMSGMMNALGGHGGQMHPDKQAMMDWRDQRPDHTPGMAPDMWHQMKMDWRALNPHHMGQPGNTGIVPPMPPQQMPPQQAQVMPGQMPINPGVGQSYAVQGLNPAASGFGLPTY